MISFSMEKNDCSPLQAANCDIFLITIFVVLRILTYSVEFADKPSMQVAHARR